MKIELIKKTEVEPRKGAFTWYVVRYGVIDKYFDTEKEATEHMTQIKAHYNKYGTTDPIEEVILSEEIIQLNQQK